MNKRGSSFIEMILFMPLAALLGFVAVDTGFYYADNATASDSLRSALAGAKGYRTPLLFTSNEVLTIPTISCEFLNQLENNIRVNLANVRTASSIEDESAELEVVGIVLEIDRHTGIQKGYSIYDHSNCPSLTYIADNKTTNLIEANMATGNNAFSNLAISEGYSLEQNLGSYKQLFRNYSIMLFARIKTHSRSINPFMTKKFLGKLYTIDNYQFLPLNNINRENANV